MKLENVDLQIIRALQEDGTLGQNALSERVGASPASCWRRVRAMEEAGVLAETVRLVNPEAVGLVVNVLCHVRLRNHLPETTAAFEGLLNLHPEIVECYAMSGDWDYLLRIITTDIASYEAFLRNKLLRNPSVSNASSAFALSRRKYTTALPV